MLKMWLIIFIILQLIFIRSTFQVSIREISGQAAETVLKTNNSSGGCANGYCSLSDNLIALNSTQGFKLLANGKTYAFFQLINNFETQIESTWCALGAIVTVLNSLHIEKPYTFGSGGNQLRYFTQQYLMDNNSCTSAIIKSHPSMPGLDLDEVQQILKCLNVDSDLYLSNETADTKLKEIFKLTYVPNRYVVVNFQRGKIYQAPYKGAHYSPLGAYNEENDRVLVMDVARYKYPPVWVKTQDMINALNTTTRQGKSRGLLIVNGPWYDESVKVSGIIPNNSHKPLLLFALFICLFYKDALLSV